VACAWGLFGADDAVGAITLLDQRAVRAGLAEVAAGTVVPLNWSMSKPDPPLYQRKPTTSHVIAISPYAQDDVLYDYNTQASTQWDGFRHLLLPGHGYYNGLPDDMHGVHAMHDHGVAGRGVLVDVAAWREHVGRPVQPGTSEPITVDDLRGTLAHQGTTTQVGDVFLVRTGWLNWYEQRDDEARTAIAADPSFPAVGLDPSEDMARFLWDSGASAVAADNPGLEVAPLGALASPETLQRIAADPAQRYLISLHSRLLVMLGIPIGEMFALDRLAALCRERGGFTFLFVSVPLNLPGGVGTPANAVAIL
jgi:hypothetical protein